MLAYQQARMLGDASGGAEEDLEGLERTWRGWFHCDSRELQVYRPCFSLADGANPHEVP